MENPTSQPNTFAVRLPYSDTAASTISTHGGWRAGAGRPLSDNKMVRRVVYLEQRHVTEIGNYQSANHCSFNEALRQILDDDMRFVW